MTSLEAEKRTGACGASCSAAQLLPVVQGCYHSPRRRCTLKCFYCFAVIELELPLVELEIAGLEPWAHQSIVILVSWRYLRHWLTDSDERHRVESILIDQARAAHRQVPV